jgi:hypothetical protein
MKCLIIVTLAALVAMAGLAVPVRGEVIMGTLSGDSTLTPTGTPGVFVQNFTGDGEDTTFGAFTPQAQSMIDFSHPQAITISGGTFLETFEQGTLFGTSSGSGTASGHGTATVTIDFVFTGGTGLFAGDTGKATFTGTITSTGATTESIDGSYVGSLQGPAVPNPGAASGAIVCLGGWAMGRALGRRRGPYTA